MKKKLYILAAAGVMAAMIAGCGQGKTSDSAASAASETAAETVQEEAEAETAEAADEAAEETAAEETPEQAAAYEKLCEELSGTNTQVLNEEVTQEQTEEGLKLTTPYFVYTVPADMGSDYVWLAMQNNDTDTYLLAFYCAAAVSNNEGGWLGSIQLTKEGPLSVEYDGGEFIAGLKDEGASEADSYISIDYPTDVQFGQQTRDAYVKLYDTFRASTGNITAAPGKELVEMTYAESLANVEQQVEGVLADAAMHSFALLDNNGRLLRFSGEDFNASAVGLSLGHSYEITYTGYIPDDGDTSEATLVDMKNIDDESENRDYELITEAATIIMDIKSETLGDFAVHCAYPVKLDGKEIASADELKAMNFDDVISEDLARCAGCMSLIYADTNVDQFLLGYDSTSHIVMEKDGSGSWKITEIVNQ